jgi:hypothetical protein
LKTTTVFDLKISVATGGENSDTRARETCQRFDSGFVNEPNLFNIPTPHMNIMRYPDILISLPQKAVSGFASLLQHGIFIPIDKEIPLLSLLLSVPGFTKEYIETAIQTIFVDGVAADRFDVTLHDGSVLAISAAMPGLAGAIFRRQGIHGVLRSQPPKHSAPPHETTGFVTVKMFNSIATDQVDTLLTEGILIDGQALHAFTQRRNHLFHPPATISFMGQTLEYSELPSMLEPYQIVRLQTRPLIGI